MSKTTIVNSVDGSLSLATALKIAWREARSSAPKFVFVILAVAAGVGVLSGVRGFSQAFRGMLLREARTLMAGDLLVRSFDSPNQEQFAALEGLQRRGATLTRITETVSMLSSDKVTTPLLVSVKAVDPQLYPFYGTVQLDPPGRLRDVLRADAVAISEDLGLRLEVGIGDYVRLGKTQLRIAGVVKLEPDRMTGSLNVGPRIMITRQGLEQTELMREGSRASERFLLRLPAQGLDVATVRAELTKAFPGALVTDFREVHPRIERGLGRATTFLSLVSLIAMIIGALGVGMAMHSHLQQRMDTIAIMKCLGGRSSQIVRIYAIQTVLLGLTGGALGILFGVGVQASFPQLIERYFQLRPERAFDLSSAVQGLAIGVLTTLLFTIPPLLQVRDVRPATIFRREMEEAKKGFRARLKMARGSLAAGTVILIGIGLIAMWLVGGELRDAITTSLTFLAGLLASVAVLSGVSWALLRGLRSLIQGSQMRLPALVRHGMANVYRPGNHAQAVLVALGVGVTFILTVFLLQHGLVNEMTRSAPKDMPNVFFINITERERAGLLDLLRAQPGLEGEPEIFAAGRARISSIDGTPIVQIPVEGQRPDRYQRELTVTWMATKPRGVTITQGNWWAADGKLTNKEPQLCVGEYIARNLRLKPGSKVDWIAGGVPFTSRVACVHREEEERFGADLDFVFNQGARGMPVTYFGGVRARRDQVSALQRVAYQKYPTVTVINFADVLAIVQEVVDQVAMIVRFVAVFAMLAGIIILASSVAATRFRRIREAAILKTLGATRKRVIQIFSVEFLILGSVAGFMGSLLASVFSSLLLTRMLDAPYRFELMPALVAMLVTALIATGAGWLASYRILGQKPMEVLRSE